MPFRPLPESEVERQPGVRIWLWSLCVGLPALAPLALALLSDLGAIPAVTASGYSLAVVLGFSVGIVGGWLVFLRVELPPGGHLTVVCVSLVFSLILSVFAQAVVGGARLGEVESLYPDAAPSRDGDAS